MQVLLGALTKTVAAAGTPEVLTATTLRVSTILVTALSTNTDNVYIQFQAAATTTLRVAIPPNGQLPINVGAADWALLGSFYLDAAVNGEGVAVLYIKGKK